MFTWDSTSELFSGKDKAKAVTRIENNWKPTDTQSSFETRIIFLLHFTNSANILGYKEKNISVSKIYGWKRTQY